jgi:hypothetical protein
MLCYIKGMARGLLLWHLLPTQRMRDTEAYLVHITSINAYRPPFLSFLLLLIHLKALPKKLDNSKITMLNLSGLKFLSVTLFAFTTNGQGLLQARNPYYGGFALPGTPEDGATNGCPSGTLTCSNQVFTFCCPNYTFCGPYQLGPYCCPTCEPGPQLSS